MVKVTCGAWHTVVISVTGDVYSFGWNKYGQVGPSHHSQALFSPILPLQNTKFEHLNACDIAAGFRHTIVQFNDSITCLFGTLYSDENENICNSGHKQRAGFERYMPFLIQPKQDSQEKCRGISAGRWCAHFRIE